MASATWSVDLAYTLGEFRHELAWGLLTMVSFYVAARDRARMTLPGLHGHRPDRAGAVAVHDHQALSVGGDRRVRGLPPTLGKRSAELLERRS